MRHSLSLSLGSRRRERKEVAISSLPDILVSGELATISGTSSAEGRTVTVTIGGETFGTDVVAGGAWSIAASPTDAMKGNSVAVVATVAGVTASSTTHVLPSGIVAGFDARLGVDTTTAYLNPDVTTWSVQATSVGGDASGYVVSATGDGTVVRRVYKQPTSSASNHGIVFDMTFAPGVLDWIQLNNATSGISVWVNIATGEVGTQIGATAVVTAVAGGQRVVVTTDTWSLAGYYVSVYGADSDGSTKCTANASDDLFTIWDVSATQTRATDITAQFPVGTEPVASQVAAESQPAYDGALLALDGTDDYMALGAGLGAQTSHHVFFALSLVSDGGYAFFLDAQSGRLILGTNISGTVGYNDGTWHTISGLTAFGLSVIEFELDGVGGTGVVRLNGVEQTLSSATYTPKSLGGTVAFGAQYNGASAWAELDLCAAFVYPAPLSSADALIVRTALADVHGVTL